MTKKTRIAGVPLEQEKKVDIALTYIHGIGISSSKKILETLKINSEKKIKNLTDLEEKKIRQHISENHVVEGDLRSQTRLAIKEKQEKRCYQGIRHSMQLPVRGQNTKNNARTRKRFKTPTITKIKNKK